MRCLLDSHVLLWFLFEPGRLSNSARQAICDPTNEVLVSHVSFWELSLKYSLGKVNLGQATPDLLPSALASAGFGVLSLDPHTAATYHLLPKVGTHKDPFDRMLVWQAIRGGPISRDQIMAAYQAHGLVLCW